MSSIFVSALVKWSSKVLGKMEVIVVLLIGAGFKVRILIPAAFVIQLASSFVYDGTSGSSPSTPTNSSPSRSSVLIAPCHPIASSAVSEFPGVAGNLLLFRDHIHYLDGSNCTI